MRIRLVPSILLALLVVSGIGNLFLCSKYLYQKMLIEGMEAGQKTEIGHGLGSIIKLFYKNELEEFEDKYKLGRFSFSKAFNLFFGQLDDAKIARIEQALKNTPEAGSWQINLYLVSEDNKEGKLIKTLNANAPKVNFFHA